MAQPQFPGAEPEPSLGFGFPPLPDESPIRLDRPPAVFAGCVMAWVGDIIGLVVGIFLLFMPSNSPALDAYSPSDRAHVASALHVVGGTLIVWCPIVILVAVFAFRGARWAPLALMVMAGCLCACVDCQRRERFGRTGRSFADVGPRLRRTCLRCAFVQGLVQGQASRAPSSLASLLGRTS